MMLCIILLTAINNWSYVWSTRYLSCHPACQWSQYGCLPHLQSFSFWFLLAHQTQPRRRQPWWKNSELIMLGITLYNTATSTTRSYLCSFRHCRHLSNVPLGTGSFSPPCVHEHRAADNARFRYTLGTSVSRSFFFFVFLNVTVCKRCSLCVCVYKAKAVPHWAPRTLTPTALFCSCW